MNIKKILWIFILIAAIALAFYSVMFIDAYSVIREVRSAFLGELTEEEVEDRPISRYDQSYIEDLLDKDEQIGSEIFIIFPITIHNFKKGDIYAFYIYTSYTSEGRICGGSAAFTNWEIQKFDGKWEIVKINEGI